MKRGDYGTYHHVGRTYLQQYLNEFDFRYNAEKSAIRSGQSWLSGPLKESG